MFNSIVTDVISGTEILSIVSNPHEPMKPPQILTWGKQPKWFS